MHKHKILKYYFYYYYTIYVIIYIKIVPPNMYHHVFMYDVRDTNSKLQIEASPHKRRLKCVTNISHRRLMTHLLHQMVHYRTTLRGSEQRKRVPKYTIMTNRIGWCTIEMAPKRSTLNGQRFICSWGNVFTSRTNRLTGHPGVNVVTP